MDTPALDEIEEPPEAPEAAPAGEEERPGSSPFPIVGVGASAGGLEAFTQLLTNLADDTGMAFVLVQHLDPWHESQLVDILARTTRMPVREAAEGMAVCPDHVYVIPPNTNMALAQGLLTLTPRGETPGLHLPIDVFFRSLAKDQRGSAIGVILSGSAPTARWGSPRSRRRPASPSPRTKPPPRTPACRTAPSPGAVWISSCHPPRLPGS
jgi:chemotaxis response regulator CheB